MSEKFLSAILIILILLSIISVVVDRKDTDKIEEDSIEPLTAEQIEKQIEIIMQNKELWDLSKTLENQTLEQYGYAITDLNHNGKLEIITATCETAGAYTYSKYYEINEDETSLNALEISEKKGDTEANIMIETVKTLIDETTDKKSYIYVYEDSLKDQNDEYFKNKQSIIWQDGNISEYRLAYTKTLNKEGKTEIRYIDNLYFKSITEEKYMQIEDIRYKNATQKLTDIGWITQADTEFLTTTDDEWQNLFKASFKTFALRDVR